jgi:hypothetical protein
VLKVFSIEQQEIKTAGAKAHSLPAAVINKRAADKPCPYSFIEY